MKNCIAILILCSLTLSLLAETAPTVDPLPWMAERKALQEKLAAIQLPSIEVRDVEARVALTGIAADAKKLAAGGGFVPVEFANEHVGKARVTLSLRRVSYLDAIRYITEVANLKFELKDGKVLIRSPGGGGRIITRPFPVKVSTFEAAVRKYTKVEGEVDHMECQKFFEAMGVLFPAGTSLRYYPTVSTVVVANMPENLASFEFIFLQAGGEEKRVSVSFRAAEVPRPFVDDLLKGQDVNSLFNQLSGLNVSKYLSPPEFDDVVRRLKEEEKVALLEVPAHLSRQNTSNVFEVFKGEKGWDVRSRKDLNIEEPGFALLAKPALTLWSAGVDWILTSSLSRISTGLHQWESQTMMMQIPEDRMDGLKEDHTLLIFLSGTIVDPEGVPMIDKLKQIK